MDQSWVLLLELNHAYDTDWGGGGLVWTSWIRLRGVCAKPGLWTKKNEWLHRLQLAIYLSAVLDSKAIYYIEAWFLSLKAYLMSGTAMLTEWHVICNRILLPSALARGSEWGIYSRNVRAYVRAYVRTYVRTCRSRLGMSICGTA